jgi:hypothetical protein
VSDAQDLVQRATDGSVDRRGQRALRVWVAGALIGLIALAGAFFALWMHSIDQDHQLGDVSKRADVNASTAQTLADQVRSLGEQPIVLPPEPGERGATGDTGPAGPQGPQGPAGQPGRDGQTPPCLSEPPQCHGADGPPGVAGKDGAPGAPGAPGKDGTDGTPGQNGTDGQPPASWTWTDDAGRTQSCTRDPGSPDSAPTYTCTASPPPTTVPGLPLIRTGG